MADDIVTWLYEQGSYNAGKACVQERDWCDKMNFAALEIERLREIVWLYVNPKEVRMSYQPVVQRCRLMNTTLKDIRSIVEGIKQ